MRVAIFTWAGDGVMLHDDLYILYVRPTSKFKIYNLTMVFKRISYSCTSKATIFVVECPWKFWNQIFVLNKKQ